MAYVYRHIRLDKNEPFYIGIGTDANFKRANEQARRSNLWKNIVAKSAYEIEILFSDISADEAKQKEIEFIKLYGRIDKRTGTLANLTDGGDGVINRTFTPEYRKKLSDKAKARVVSEAQKEKLRKYRTGIPNSPEARKKISIANTGNKMPESHIAKMKLRIGDKNPSYGKRGAASKSFKGYIIAYKDGIEVGRYEGLKGCEALGVDRKTVSAVLLGKRNHTAGYTFKREAK